MGVEIRPAEVSDLDRCRELLAALSGATDEPMVTSDRSMADVFRQLVGRDRGEVLVADENGKLLGMASVSYNLAMRYGGEYCQLEELIVDPEARGKNVGALLVQATVDRARERGCAEYGLYLVATTEHNLPFYQKFGFEKVGSELRQRL